MKKLSLLLTISALLIIACGGGGDQVPAFKGGAAGELTPVKLPPIESRVLDNGLKIVTVEHHELPVVSFRLMVKSGSAQDPLGKAGVASITASLLTKGTKSRSATDIADEIDFVGGNLNSSSDWDRCRVTSQVLKKHFDTGLDLFADVILNPVFQKSEIERLRKRKISSYINDKDDPANLCNEYFGIALYGDHPFGYEESGTGETLAKISRADITGFYKSNFVPNNAMIVVAGDITPEEAFAAIEGKFGSWKQKDVSKPELPEAAKPAGYKIVLVDRPDATQSQIRIGHFGIARSNPDYFNISLMNYILGGGGFSSRLMKIIRSEMGLTYGISSSFSSRLDAGPFKIGTFTKNESVGDAIGETIKQIRKFQGSLPDAAELDDAKSYLNGSYPMRFETPDRIAGQLMSVELYQLGENYISTYRDKVQAVTLEQVQAAAKKYVDPDNLVIVVVGKAEEVLDQLQEFGEVEVIEIN